MLLPLLLLSLASLTSAPQTSGAVVGTVIGEGGKPLVEARVLLADSRSQHSWPIESEVALVSQDHPVREAFTGEDGKFRLSGLQPGPARLVVRAAKHETLRLGRVFVAAHGTTDLGNIELTDGAKLSGFVVEGNGIPIGEARIYSVPIRDDSKGLGVSTAAFEVETDANGGFDLDNLALGEWTLLIEAEGYAVARFEGELLRGGAHEIAFPLTLEEEAEIDGRVRSIESVRDFSHLVVRAIPATELDTKRREPKLAQGYVETEVRETGEFTLRGLRPDTLYFVRAQAPDQSFLANDAWAPTSMHWSGDLNASVDWLPSARVSFRVLEVSTAEPAKNFTMRLLGATPEEPFLPPSEQVKRVLRNVRPKHSPKEDDSFIIKAGGNGFREFESRSFALEPDQLVEAGDITLWAHQTLEVLVRDAETHSAIQYARVSIRQDISVPPPRESSMGITDIGGRVVLNDFGGTSRGIGILAKGYAPAAFASPFQVTDDVLVVDLVPGFELAASIFDSNGEPVYGEAVRATFTGPVEESVFGGTEDFVSTAFTDLEGLAIFRHLASTEYTIDLAAWDKGHQVVLPQVVLPVAGPRRGISFGLDSRARIDATVFEAGLPLAAAEIRFDGLRARTNEEGRFRLDSVDPRQSDSELHHPLRSMLRHERVGLQHGTNELVFHLPDTTVGGLVVDELGTPISNAAVYLSESRRHIDIDLDRSEGESLFLLEQASRGEPVTHTDANGSFLVRGLRSALGLTLSARTSTGFIGLTRVRGISPNAQITGVQIEVKPPARLDVVALNEQLSPKSPLALVATVRGDAQAGAWLRMVAPYHGQSVSFDDLPPGRWELSLVSLSEFGAIVGSQHVKTVRLESGGVFEVALDR